MKSTTWTLIGAIAIFATLGASLRLSAQEEREHSKRPAYVLKDLGTFGGPNSFFFSAPVVQSVNNRGTVVGLADLPARDPFAPSCFNPSDCHTIHAFQWHRGVLEDLGTLPGGSNSAAFWVNEHGVVMGGSENGVIDPVIGGPQQFTVLWKDGQIWDRSAAALVAETQ